MSRGWSTRILAFAMALAAALSLVADLGPVRAEPMPPSLTALVAPQHPLANPDVFAHDAETDAMDFQVQREPNNERVAANPASAQGRGPASVLDAIVHARIWPASNQLKSPDMGHAPPPTSTGPVEPTEPATHSPLVPDTVPQAQEPNKPDHDHPRPQTATPPPHFDPTALAPVQRELYHLQTIQHRARAKYATKHAELTRALRMAEGKLERARDWVGQLPRLFSVAGADDIEEEESEFAVRRRVRALAQHAAITRARVVRLRASYQDHMQQWIAREELLRRLLREVPGAGAQLHWGE